MKKDFNDFLAGRGDAWDQQNAVQGDDPAQPATQGKIMLKIVTTRTIYTSRMTDLLVPPKVELKFPLVNFKKLVYPRLQNKVLEVKQRDLLFSLTHGIYRNRARLFQQNRAEDNLCQNPACKRENLVHDVEHIFCLCYRVRAAWNWTRRKIVDFMTDQGRPPDVSNPDILLERTSSNSLRGSGNLRLAPFPLVFIFMQNCLDKQSGGSTLP